MELCLLLLNTICDFSLFKKCSLHGALDRGGEVQIRHYVPLGTGAHLCSHPADPVGTAVWSTGPRTLVHSQLWQSQRTSRLGWAQPGDHHSGSLLMCGSEGRRSAQPSGPQRQTGSILWLMKWLNVGKLFYFDRFASCWTCDHGSSTLVAPALQGSAQGFHFSHFTLLDEPDSCWLIYYCIFLLLWYCRYLFCHFLFFFLKL